MDDRRTGACGMALLYLLRERDMDVLTAITLLGASGLGDDEIARLLYVAIQILDDTGFQEVAARARAQIEGSYAEATRLQAWMNDPQRAVEMSISAARHLERVARRGKPEVQA